VVSRELGEVRLELIDSAGPAELDAFVDRSCLGGTTVNTDTWAGYGRVGGRHGRSHAVADHSGPRGTWAIDADGDGVCEVHCDTMEGIWTGARNFPRPFRGVSKWRASQYVAMFERSHDIKKAKDEFLGVMLGLSPHTEFRVGSPDWYPAGRFGVPMASGCGRHPVSHRLALRRFLLQGLNVRPV
jgi:hypothetical protein